MLRLFLLSSYTIKVAILTTFLLDSLQRLSPLAIPTKMPFQLYKALTKFIVVRVRRSTKTQSNSTDTCQGSSSISSAHFESCWRQASDMAQTSLPLLQTAAGAIPLAGPPIQAAINGLLMILQNIDVRGLFGCDDISRVQRLSKHRESIKTRRI